MPLWRWKKKVSQWSIISLNHLSITLQPCRFFMHNHILSVLAIDYLFIHLRLSLLSWFIQPHKWSCAMNPHKKAWSIKHFASCDWCQKKWYLTMYVNLMWEAFIHNISKTTQSKGVRHTQKAIMKVPVYICIYTYILNKIG